MFFLKAVSSKSLKAAPLSIAVTGRAEDSLRTRDGRSRGETGVSLVLPGWCHKALKQVSSISFAVTFCSPASC